MKIAKKPDHPARSKSASFAFTWLHVGNVFFLLRT